MQQRDDSVPSIIPRSKWWWLGLALLLILAGWLYLRGYNASLPFINQVDEPYHLLAAQHTIHDGSARGVNYEAYPPGMRTLSYLLLKHIKSPEAHHGTMLPALRLITITAWMLVVVVVALLGSMLSHPLTGLMAAAIWIVNPWVVERARWALPDGYLTLFTLLALWLALVSCLRGRRSFSTAAVYSIMLAIVFKTQALFVAPLILLLPLINLSRMPERRKDVWQLTFWNSLRFAVFLFWLLLIYPTLEANNIPYWVAPTDSVSLLSVQVIWHNLLPVLQSFQPLHIWKGQLLLTALLWRYRQRINGIVLIVLIVSGLCWLIGISLFGMQDLRQFFVLGAMLALLYAMGFTVLIYLLEEALIHLPPPPPRNNYCCLFIKSYLRASLSYFSPLACCLLIANRMRWRINSPCMTVAMTWQHTWTHLFRQACISPITTITELLTALGAGTTVNTTSYG